MSYEYSPKAKAITSQESRRNEAIMIGGAKSANELESRLRMIGSLQGPDGRKYSANELMLLIDEVWESSDRQKGIMKIPPVAGLRDKVRQLFGIPE